MKHSKNWNCLLGMGFGLVISFATVGAMATGLRLEVSSMKLLLAVCALAALVGGIFFRVPRGDVALLCLLVPVTWLVFRREETVEQILRVLSQMARLYDLGYGWGIPGFLSRAPGGDTLWALGIVGTVCALAVTWTVCRCKGLFFAMISLGIPFATCFVLVDTVPQERYLYLWLVGVTLLVLTQGQRRVALSQSISLTVLAALPVAAVLGLLFWLFPRGTYHYQPERLQEQIANWIQETPDILEEVSDDVAQVFSGSVQSSRVSLSGLGPRPKRTYPVMEVTAPQEGLLYLRARDYDVYDGSSWSASRNRSEQLYCPGLTSSGNVDISTRRSRDVLYLPYYPGSGIRLTGGELKNTDGEKTYSFAQWQLPETWREQLTTETWWVELTTETESSQLEFPVGDGTDREQTYLELPLETAQWARELAGQITGGVGSATDMADAIGEYVKQSAAYDRNTARMTGTGDFARWFLEESDTGYCVHFATAAAVLLRGAGVEARYVEGYLAPCEAGVATVVRESMAHAWVEYYEPALEAWIVLDPTPGEFLREIEPTQPPQITPNGPGEPTTQPGETTVPTQPPEETPAPTVPQPTEASPEGEETAGRILPGIFLVLLIPALLEGQRRLRLLLRASAFARGSNASRLIRRWRELERLHSLMHTPVPEEACQLAQRASYSQHRIHREELEAMDGYLNQAREKLEKVPWYQKLLNWYIFTI